jgi:hypothetical protein
MVGDLLRTLVGIGFAMLTIVSPLDDDADEILFHKGATTGVKHVRYEIIYF